MRPAIAKPLQAAEHDISSRQFAAALKEVSKAEAVPGKTSDETLTIEQVRAAIDSAAKNYAAAAADYGRIIAGGNLPADQLKQMAEAQASFSYQAGDYAGTIAVIKTHLANDPQFTQLLLQSYLKTNNCDALSDAVGKMAKPPEADIQMVAFCDNESKNSAGYAHAIAMLVENYPSPAYWTQLIGLEESQSEFSDRLALDLFRLKVAAGVAASETDYMDMTQSALQMGLTNEANAIITKGFASGILGSGPDAERQGRLKALVDKRQAAATAGMAQQIAQATAQADQSTLFSIGFNQVDGGDAAGLTLMGAAIRSGKLTQPGQAEMELGEAYREAGQAANAKAMWNAVQGGGGPAELAKLWLALK